MAGQPTASQLSQSLQKSYTHLRRLRLHGLIERIPHTFRYRVTRTGQRSATFLTRVHDQVLRTGLAEITDPSPPAPTALRAADRAYQAAINDLTRQAGLAA
jgi:Mn-dependent DtxR family transcriptional regulator